MRIFTEIQKFNQWWVLALIYGLFLVSFLGFVKGLSLISEGNMSEFFTKIFPPFIILAVISVLFFILKLKTRIDEKGIHYGFWPFQQKLRLASWREIEKASVRKYKPLLEFGGWGYKYSMKGNGKVYNVKGNMGIQIVFKDNTRTLIGTQKAEAAQQVIDYYISKKDTYEN